MSTYRPSGVVHARAASPMSDIRAVVIDDSGTICEGAAAVLRGAGCRVATAADGFAALVEVIDCRPHIIFVDSHMPRLDGYQTCAVIKRNEAYRHVPVILLTNPDQPLDPARAEAAGIDGHLTKPFTGDELLSAVREHVQSPAGVSEDG